MATSRYAIPDEPRPGAQERWIVDPMWPLFAQMLGGSWLALPWFVFNGIALGSPTRRREWLLAGASLAGSAALLFAIAVIAKRYDLGRTGVQLALLAVVALKLGVGYALYMLQARSFELWRHYGGVPVNGMLPVVAAIFLERMLFTTFVTSTYLQLVLE